MRIQLTLLLLVLSLGMSAQEKNNRLYFEDISEYPVAYSSNLIMARMIDGLGFRYFWATEGLSPHDLQYRISETSRTSDETLDHIYGLSKFIRNSILENNKDTNKEILEFDDKRNLTLENLRLVSEMFKNSEKEFEFESTSIPFWNLINGPIEDALWHCGQIVMMRRASGNPFNSKVSVFQGKTRK